MSEMQKPSKLDLNGHAQAHVNAHDNAHHDDYHDIPEWLRVTALSEMAANDRPNFQAST